MTNATETSPILDLLINVGRVSKSVAREILADAGMDAGATARRINGMERAYRPTYGDRVILVDDNGAIYSGEAAGSESMFERVVALYVDHVPFTRNGVRFGVWAGWVAS